MQTLSSLPETGSELSLADVANALQRKWWFVAGSVAVVSVLTIFWTLAIPNQYESSSAIVIRNPEIAITGEASPLSTDMLTALAEADSTKYTVFTELAVPGGPLSGGLDFRIFQNMLRTHADRKPGPDPSFIPMIRLIVRSEKPELAKLVANAWAEEVTGKTKSIYKEGVENLSSFVKGAYDNSNTSLLQVQDDLATATNTAGLAVKRVRLDLAQATYNDKSEEVRSLEVDQHLQAALLADAESVVKAGEMPDGRWVGHIWYEQCVANPDFASTATTTATQAILTTVRRLAANERALEDFLEKSEIQYKTTQLANLQTFLQTIAASIVTSQDSLAVAQTEYAAMNKALQGIDKKIVLDKAITNDALWAAYLAGRLPAGDKILPLKEEVYNPLFGDVSGQVVKLGAAMEGQQGRVKYYQERQESVKKEISALSRDVSRLKASQAAMEAAVSGDQSLFSTFQAHFLAMRQGREETAQKMADNAVRMAVAEHEVAQAENELRQLQEQIMVSENQLSNLKRRSDDVTKTVSELASREVDITLLKVSAEKASRTGASVLYEAEANPLKVAPARTHMVLTAAGLAFLISALLVILADRLRASRPRV